MKIGIFVSVIRESGGLYQYTEAILKAIDNLNVNDEYIVFTWSKDIMRFDEILSKRIKIEVMPNNILTRSDSIQSILTGDGLDVKQSGFNYLARDYFISKNIDLLIYPAPLSFTFECGVPYIMAIHDLQHRLNPEFPEVSACGIWHSREYLFRNAVRFAHGILVDSDVGKEDVLTFYNDYISADKIYILQFLPAYTPQSIKISEDKKISVKKKYNLPEKFIFYPAQFWLHKNHARLVHAIHKIRVNKKQNIPLVLVGSVTMKSPEGREFVFENVMKLAEQLNVKDLIYYLGYIPDEEMPVLYNMACALIMPTFFGPTNIPIYEAWAFGCPVLTSNIRGVREQVGEAGLLVDPTNVNEIADGILKLWEDAQLRERLIESGYKRVGIYTLKEFTEKLKFIIDDVKRRLKSEIEDFEIEASSLNEQAILKLQQGDRDGAKEAFLEIIKEHPSFYPAYNNLACIYWDEGDFENAERYFEEAIEVVKNQAIDNRQQEIIDGYRSVIMGCGEMLMRLKKYKKAKELFEEYLKNNPEDKEVKRMFDKCEKVLEKVKILGKGIG